MRKILGKVLGAAPQMCGVLPHELDIRTHIMNECGGYMHSVSASDDQSL